MKKSDVVKTIFQQSQKDNWDIIQHEKGLAFAPTNIALCKYWGKRDNELNLPMTSSLSVALPEKGALTTLMLHDHPQDQIMLNGELVGADTQFAKRLSQFLDLFRPRKNWYLTVNIEMNLPVAAGLASSACGFASVVLALNHLFNWQLTRKELSILARLGSGSAARSLWNGIVEWHAGLQDDGMDSFAEPLPYDWPELCVGILSFSSSEKKISSRDAMQRTVSSSLLYKNWPKKVMQDLLIMHQALQSNNFALLGGTAESNALNMHATMLSSWPPICYFLPETIAAMQKIWQLREQGLEIYFTEDAGPNLKLLFLAKDHDAVLHHFPAIETINVFVS